MIWRLPTWSLGWLVPTVILLSRPAGAAGVCAIVETGCSDRTMAESIASLLEQHGVSTRGEHCESIRAHVLVEELTCTRIARYRPARRLHGMRSGNHSTSPETTSSSPPQNISQKKYFCPALMRPIAGSASSSLRM